MPEGGRDPAPCLCCVRVLIPGGEAGTGVLPPQERTGVKMVMIQDGPLPTGADKPLRITGDPFKVQVGEKARIAWVLGVGGGSHLGGMCRACVSFKKS